MWQMFRSQRSGGFRTRSVERDQETLKSIESIETAINTALELIQSERDGLDRRMQDALARASVSVGTASDEYLTRDEVQSAGLKHYESELANGRSRLAQLDEWLGNLRFIRAAFYTRFSTLTPKIDRGQSQ